MFPKMTAVKTSAAFSMAACFAIATANATPNLLEPATATPTKAVQSTKPSHTLAKHSSWVYAVALSSDGQFAASGGYDRKVKIWDQRTGQLLHSLSVHGDAIEALAFSPTNTAPSRETEPQLASGSWDKTIKLWNPRSGKLIRTLRTSHWVRSIAFSSDGQILASGNQDGNIQLWNPRTGKLIDTFRNSHRVNSVAFSPDGQTIAFGDHNGDIQIWNLRTGRIISRFTGHNRAVRSVAFSPDGKILASGSYDQTIKLWHFKTGNLLRTLTHPSPNPKAIHTVDFVRSTHGNTGGQILASGSYDRTIQLWRLGKMDFSYIEVKPLRTLWGHTKAIWSVAFSLDGKILVSGSADKTIKFWPIKK